MCFGGKLSAPSFLFIVREACQGGDGGGLSWCRLFLLLSPVAVLPGDVVHWLPCPSCCCVLFGFLLGFYFLPLAWVLEV